MTMYSMTVLVDVDDEGLAEHVARDVELPPPADPTEWFGGDLVFALDAGLCSLEHSELTVEEFQEIDS